MEMFLLHELPVTQSILKIADEEAVKNNANKVTKIKIVIGELTGMVPECIQYYFDILSKGTISEGAIIQITKLPLKASCNRCSFIGDFSEYIQNKCPKCGSSDIKVESGNEFYIDSLEVE